MRVLVTGGAGFIGSHVVDALVTADHEVVVLDRVTPSWPNPDARYVDGDVRDPSAWERALDGGVDAISHHAARVGLGVDFADVSGYVADNDTGTAAGLNVMHRMGFEGRLVLASSMVVYGEGRYRCAEDGIVRPGPRPAARLNAGLFEPPCPHCGRDLTSESVTEDSPVDPRNVYAATKLHQEHLLAAYVREHAGASAAALRYHNVYGPRMPSGTPYAGVASIFAGELAAGRAPAVFEDGAQTRDFVHVYDVARSNLLALDVVLSDAEMLAVNVCTGRPLTVGEMALALWSTGASRSEQRPRITGGWRPGDVRHVFASPIRAAEHLGFNAEIAFEAGLKCLYDEGHLMDPPDGNPRP